MAYDFFFSYTRGDQSGYLEQFYNDLSVELRQQRGYGKDKIVGFFDQHEIESGTEWEADISQALQESKVMICIYSPGYFNSPYCGKEWQVFKDRVNKYQKQRTAAGVNAPSLPPVIIPVFWQAPLPVNLNESIKAIQYITGDPAAEHNQAGLKYMLQKIGDYKSSYVNYIHKLATQIRVAADKYQLPLLEPLPALNKMPSAFDKRVDPPLPNLTNNYSAKPPRERKHVRFVFVAGDPNEFGNIRSAEPYLENGRGDWRPFPGMDGIGPYVQRIVSREDLGFFSDELPLSDNLLQEIEHAYTERKIIIFLVDGWTIKWKQEYRAILASLDQNSRQGLINWSVLVPSNLNDPELASQQAEIEQIIKSTFDIRANFTKPIFYRDSIHSADELRDTLSEVLIQIKAEMHQRAEGGKSIQSPIQKPNVSNS